MLIELTIILSISYYTLHLQPCLKEREVVQPGRIPGLGPGGRRFESCPPDLAKMQKAHLLMSFLHFAILRLHLWILRDARKGFDLPEPKQSYSGISILLAWKPQRKKEL